MLRSSDYLTYWKNMPAGFYGVDGHFFQPGSKLADFLKTLGPGGSDYEAAIVRMKFMASQLMTVQEHRFALTQFLSIVRNAVLGHTAEWEKQDIAMKVDAEVLKLIGTELGFNPSNPLWPNSWKTLLNEGIDHPEEFLKKFRAAAQRVSDAIDQALIAFRRVVGEQWSRNETPLIQIPKIVATISEADRVAISWVEWTGATTPVVLAWNQFPEFDKSGLVLQYG
jgi:hypothetical protein